MDVMVLAGGLSHERDVSMRSGRRVQEELRASGAKVTLHDVDSTLIPALRDRGQTVVWPMLCPKKLASMVLLLLNLWLPSCLVEGWEIVWQMLFYLWKDVMLQVVTENQRRGGTNGALFATSNAL